MQVIVFGLSLLLIAGASAADASESQVDSVISDKNDISFLQASLNLQKTADTCWTGCATCSKYAQYSCTSCETGSTISYTFVDRDNTGYGQCKEEATTSTTTTLGYVQLSSSTCEAEGYDLVYTYDDCYAAATALSLSPDGGNVCYWDSAASGCLFQTTNNLVKFNDQYGDSASVECNSERTCLCQTRATYKNDYKYMEIESGKCTDYGYSTPPGSLLVCFLAADQLGLEYTGGNKCSWSSGASGCLFTNSQIKYNINTNDEDCTSDRTCLCVEATTTTQATTSTTTTFGYVQLSSSTCEAEGYDLVYTYDDCYAAAEALSLSPEGGNVCYWDSAASGCLFQTTNNLVKFNDQYGDSASVECSSERTCLCQTRATYKNDYKYMEIESGKCTDYGYSTPPGSLLVCFLAADQLGLEYTDGNKCSWNNGASGCLFTNSQIKYNINTNDEDCTSDRTCLCVWDETYEIN